MGSTKHDVAATHQAVAAPAGGGAAYDSLMAYHQAHEVKVDTTAGTTASTSLGATVETQPSTQASASELALGAGTGASSGAAVTPTAPTAAPTAASPVAARGAARLAAGPWTAEALAEGLQAGGSEGLFIALEARQPAQGIALLKTAGAWNEAVANLPLGTMSAAAVRALDTLVADDVFVISDAMALFRPRFNHQARNTTGSWTQPVMKSVWKQLALLPVSDISENTVLTTFDAIIGTGGFGPSWEGPTTVNTIQLGESNSVGPGLEHTVRHEVGHGVHAQIPGPINTWLQNDMQFWFIDFESWITALGGYPDTFTNANGKEKKMNGRWQKSMKGLVENFTGSVSWSPTAATPDAGQDADMVGAWAAMPEPLKNACAQSTSHWYNNYTNFQAVGDKRYFLNHWYHRPFTMGAAAFATIGAIGDVYTAMSEKEFFANCYAEFFADPAGVRDPSKWGGRLSAEIQSFFRECIIARHPYASYTAAQTASKETAATGTSGAP